MLQAEMHTRVRTREAERDKYTKKLEKQLALARAALEKANRRAAASIEKLGERKAKLNPDSPVFLPHAMPRHASSEDVSEEFDAARKLEIAKSLDLSETFDTAKQSSSGETSFEENVEAAYNALTKPRGRKAHSPTRATESEHSNLSQATRSVVTGEGEKREIIKPKKHGAQEELQLAEEHQSEQDHFETAASVDSTQIAMPQLPELPFTFSNKESSKGSPTRRDRSLVLSNLQISGALPPDPPQNTAILPSNQGAPIEQPKFAPPTTRSDPKRMPLLSPSGAPPPGFMKPTVEAPPPGFVPVPAQKVPPGFIPPQRQPPGFTPVLFSSSPNIMNPRIQVEVPIGIISVARSDWSARCSSGT